MKINDKINKSEIDDVRRIQIELLKEVHDICVKYNLKYTLGYGTLIGAIRHKGFIPWDDDIDILMPRTDYNKLIKIWEDETTNDFILQTYENNIDYTNNFAKIRKNNTTFLQDENEKKKQYHKGIFIDIFPGDRLASSKVSRIIQFVFFALNLLSSRGYKSGNKGLIYIIESLVLMLPKRMLRTVYKYTEKYMTSWNNTNNPFVFSCTILSCKKYYDSEMFNKLVLKEFENEKFLVTVKYDSILREEYGDYMQLPDEKDRVWTHHPILIDINRNYEDIKEGGA